MQDTNDKMNELMDAFNKKLKTRRILLMSKYSDITEAPISVQAVSYTHLDVYKRQAQTISNSIK